MKKTFLFALTGISTAAIALGAIISGGSASVFAQYSPATSGTWVHYERVEATPTQKGIREYWVQCGGGYQFTAPLGVTPVEGGTHDTSGFTENDDRWIYNVSLTSQDLDMTLGDKSLNLGDYSDGTVTSIVLGEENVGTDASNLDLSAFAENTTHGEKAAVVNLTKSGKEYAMFGTVTLATKLIGSAQEFFTYVMPKPYANLQFEAPGIGTSITGYYKLTSNISLVSNNNNTFSRETGVVGTNLSGGANIWSNRDGDKNNSKFVGTLNGGGHVVTCQSLYAGILFNIQTGAVIKNIEFHDLWYGVQTGKYATGACLIASIAFNATFENVKTRIIGAPASEYTDGQRTEVPTGTALKTAMASTGNCGWLFATTTQGMTFRNCEFRAQIWSGGGWKNINIVSFFTCGQNVANNTFTNCTAYCNEYTCLFWSRYLENSGKYSMFFGYNNQQFEGDYAANQITVNGTLKTA